MRWEDVTVDGAWTIATELGEKGNAGALELPDMALEIIRAQNRIEGNPYLFAGRRTKGYMNGYS